MQGNGGGRTSSMSETCNCRFLKVPQVKGKDKAQTQPNAQAQVVFVAQFQFGLLPKVPSPSGRLCSDSLCWPLCRHKNWCDP